MHLVAALDRVGGRARTMQELERQLTAGLRSEGPYLIDLVL